MFGALNQKSPRSRQANSSKFLLLKEVSSNINENTYVFKNKDSGRITWRRVVKGEWEYSAVCNTITHAVWK